MQQQYNWKAILAGTVPVSIIIFFVFLSNISMNLKWTYFILGAAAALGITYYFDRKRQNIFTSPFIVIIAALLAYGLKSLGLL